MHQGGQFGSRQRVLRTDSPRSDESLNGLLLRISEINGYERPGWLLELAQAPAYAVTARTSLDDLAYAVRQPPAALQERAYWNPARKSDAFSKFFGKPVRHYHIERKGVRVCPRCLESDGYCRAVWDIRLVTVCPEHDCALIDACPSCKEPISWARQKVTACDCGCDWRTVTSQQADPKLAEVTAIIHGAAGFPIRRKINREQWSWLRRAQLVDVLDAIYIFGIYGLSDGKSAARQWGTNRSAADMQALLREAAGVLSEWPEGFYRFLDRMRSNRDPEGKTGIVSEFGDFYSALHRRFAKRRLGFLQNAFQEYMARNWDGGYVKPQARWARPSGNMTFVSRPEVARILGIAAQTVDVLLREGELEGETQPMGKTRSYAVVTRRSLSDYQKRRKYIVESEQAAQLLGVSRGTYREMVNAGILEANRGRVTYRTRKAFEVDRRLIDGLLSRLERQATRGSIGVVVDYKTAVEKFSRRNQGNVGLIRATLGKQISVGGIDHGEVGLRRLRFTEKSLSDYLANTKISPRSVLDQACGSGLVFTNPPFKSRLS